MRLENWEDKLYSYIESVKIEPFKWGKFDCCSFTAGAIKEITGFDFYKDYKNKYDSEETAYLTLYEVSGYKTIIGLLNNLFEKKELSMAQRGDIVLSQQKAIGICLGVKSAFTSPEGLTYLETSNCLKCWGI